MPHSLPPVQASDHRVRIADSVADGALFVRTWDPESAKPLGKVPILLLHDSLGCIALWRSFPERLAAETGRRVIAYDRLGFGQSDPHPGRLGVDFVTDEAARALPALCAALAVEDFILCGHSVGGGMSIEAAARHPEPCRALITIAAQAFVEDRTLAGIRKAQADFEDPAALARLAKYHGEKARWVVDAWVESWLSPAFADWTVDAALAAIRCPVLALHGENDEYGSLIHPTRIAEGRGTAEILPGIGHVPHREAEGMVTGLIREFVEGIA